MISRRFLIDFCRSISVWNLSESFEYNNHFTGTLALLPSFTTEVEQGHRTKVVGLRSFQDQIDEVLNFTLVPSKQVSLLRIWSLVCLMCMFV